VKAVIATIIAGMVLTGIPSANAAPVEFSGDVRIKYEVHTAADTPTESGMAYSLTLRGEKKSAKVSLSTPGLVLNMQVIRF
jgi:hypothetical protein